MSDACVLEGVGHFASAPGGGDSSLALPQHARDQVHANQFLLLLDWFSNCPSFASG